MHWNSSCPSGAELIAFAWMESRSGVVVATGRLEDVVAFVVPSFAITVNTDANKIGHATKVGRCRNMPASPKYGI